MLHYLHEMEKHLKYLAERERERERGERKPAESVNPSVPPLDAPQAAQGGGGEAARESERM